MALLILALFIGIPIAEIALFIEVGGWLGLWPTLALVIATAVAGTGLIRMQGLAVLERARAAMDRGQPPVGELFHGACLLVAGALLLTPGFLTDALGLGLLVPPFRAVLGAFLWRYLSAHIVVAGPGGRGPGAGDGPIVDADYTDVTPGDGEKGGENAPSSMVSTGNGRQSPWTKGVRRR